MSDRHDPYRPDDLDPIGPGENISNPEHEELPEAWEEDDINPDAPDWPTPRSDDVPEVEQPTEPYEEDEVPLESARDLDELPADADIVEDESAVDHNLPDNEGMPQ
jgi:hypothetical protein